MIGKGIFHGDQKSPDPNEKSRDLSYYEIFQQKILKSQTFKKNAVHWYFYVMLNIFSQFFMGIKTFLSLIVLTALLPQRKNKLQEILQNLTHTKNPQILSVKDFGLDLHI